jgi:hypothetical protein
MATTNQENLDMDPSSTIDELQNVFGSILLARQDSNERKRPEAPTHWTGAFELFAFPRELRDRIYFHYLDCPKGMVYHRNNRSNGFPFPEPETASSLFMTCQQVYDEALEIFYRHNQIEVGGRYQWHYPNLWDRKLNGILRCFPQQPATQLQRISVNYSSFNYTSEGSGSSDDFLKMGETFLQMLRDAYVIKSVFPKLREFTASWEARPVHFNDEEDMQLEGASEDDETQIWLAAMKRWVGESKVVPPRWVRFELIEFENQGMGPRVRKYAEPMNDAYRSLVREMSPLSDERAELDLARCRWLKESGLGKRGKKVRKSGI